MQTLSAPERTRQALMLTASLLSMLALLGYGAYSLLSGILAYDPANTLGLEAGTLTMLCMAACAGLVAPALFHSLRRLSGKDIHPRRLPAIKFWQAALILTAWVICLVIAWVATALLDFGWLVSLPFILAGMLLPVLLLAWTAAGGLTGDSPRRLWAVFGFSLGGSTFLAMMAEYLVIGVIAVMIGVVAFANPEVQAVLTQVERLVNDSPDAEVLIAALSPYLVNPWVYLTLLALLAGIGPVIEEALKPLALWFLGKKLHSPAEGFALGALCGAGFALVEGLLATSAWADSISMGLATRFGGTLLHITCSGLVGWGIASARLHKQYGRLLGAFLAAVAVHGLWNAATLTIVYGGLRVALIMNPAAGGYDLPGILAALVGIGVLGTLFLVILVILPLLNRRLRLGLPAPVVSPAGNDIIAPLTPQPERISVNGMDSQGN